MKDLKVSLLGAFTVNNGRVMQADDAIDGGNDFGTLRGIVAGTEGTYCARAR
jgi:hypothetical protein